MLRWIPMAVGALAVLAAASEQVSSVDVRASMDPQTRELVLTWDAGAPAVQAATGGTLSIKDGDQEENVELIPTVLRTGRLRYEPRTEDVSFRLTLTRPLADFTPPAPHKAEEPEIPTPPALKGGDAAVPPPPEVTHPQADAPPPPPAPAAVPKGGKIVEPVLIRQVKPLYPAFAAEHHIQGAVKLRIVIDASGKVSKAEVLDGAPVLHKSALDAVRQWIYQPARLDNEPIGFALTVTLNFSASLVPGARQAAPRDRR